MSKFTIEVTPRRAPEQEGLRDQGCDQCNCLCTGCTCACPCVTCIGSFPTGAEAESRKAPGQVDPETPVGRARISPLS